MWITLLSVTLVCFSATVAGEYCTDVFNNCQRDVSLIRCFEERIATCRPKGRSMPSFIRAVRSSEEAEMSPSAEHRVHIPSSALQRSRGAGSEEWVRLVATVMESTYFRFRGRRINQLVLGGLVLMVKAGTHSVTNLPQPIILTFNYNEQVKNGNCVFWQSTLDDGTGYWSTDGCETNDTGTEFVCSCNHMSFFAVLVNPVLTVDEHNATYLSYITYIGSALSIVFTVVSLIIYISLQRRRPEKVIGVHLQLTGALLCLHLSFLLCCFGVWQLNENEESWVCQGLGLFLHWSLLATISWTALEGFHLYLLLVQVFNIYVRRYLLKLSLVGWGLPTLIAVVCGISGCYGKYNLELRDANNHTSTAHMCWMSSHFPQRLLVSYVTTVAFPCLVILCNSCMLGVVVFKLWGLKAGHGGIERNSSWKKMNKRNWMKLWKDCATVLGLSCVLGLSWGLATTTYVSLTGIYVFTILNSLQGVFMFLWCLALTCKSRSDDDSSAREASSQKVMTTSF